MTNGFEKQFKPSFGYWNKPGRSPQAYSVSCNDFGKSKRPRIRYYECLSERAGIGTTITWVGASYIRTRKVSVVGAACGSVAGLVAITPASGFVSTGGALIIGLVAGGLCYSATLLRARSTVDDALDVFAVHGVGGMFGAVATGVFEPHSE